MSSTLAPAASKLALLGGTPVGKVTLPKFPTFTEKAIGRAADMLRQGKLFGLGRKHVPEIGEAEGVISKYHANRHVLATSSGHAALQSALAGVNASQARADQLSEAYDRGQVTDVAKVMLARQEAGVGFEATLQVRNKLLSAYQDIMKLGV